MNNIWQQRIMVGLILLVVAAALVYAFLPQPVPVDLAVIETAPLQVTIDEEGRTRVKEVYVVSAPLSGHVKRIERDVGDPVVAEMTLLATIEPSDPTFLDVRSRTQAEAEVKAAEAAKALADAELVRAQAELDFALLELDRARRLVAREHLSQQALDRAEMDARTRQAVVKTANANLQVKLFELEMARAQLINPGRAAGGSDACDCVDVVAPVNGRVLRLIQESETVVQAGAPLLEIGDPQDLEVVIELLSTDAVQVAAGAQVFIEDWGGGKTLAGKVRRVEPFGFTKISALGIEEQRVKVIVDFTDPPDQWRPLGHGYRIEARILVWQAEDLLQVPLSALFREGDDWAVFVEEEGRARLRKVSVGQRNSEAAQLLDGLSAGDAVVVHPSDRVLDGVRLERRG